MTDYGSNVALIVVDVQNDFADPEGALYVAGAEALIPEMNRTIEEAVKAEALVVYSRDAHPSETPHFEVFGGIWPVHCVAGTPGAEFHPELNVIKDSIQILKGTGGEDGYSAFSLRDPLSGDTSRTELAGLLRDNEVEEVVIIGLATDYCVKETALDALELGFGVTVLRAAIGAVNLEPDDGARALAAIEAAGGRIE